MFSILQKTWFLFSLTNCEWTDWGINYDPLLSSEGVSELLFPTSSLVSFRIEMNLKKKENTLTESTTASASLAEQQKGLSGTLVFMLIQEEDEKKLTNITFKAIFCPYKNHQTDSDRHSLCHSPLIELIANSLHPVDLNPELHYFSNTICLARNEMEFISPI